MPRIWMFIDGYNFYYSVKNGLDRGNRDKIHLGWCNFRSLAETYMLDHFGMENAILEKILYFTAPVTRDLEATAGETSRQDAWLRGLNRIEGIEIIKGVHLPGERGRKRTEKMTDVNIALSLVAGAKDGGYDAAILLCNDSDQAPAVKSVIEGQGASAKPIHVWTYSWDYRAQALTALDGSRQHVITPAMLSTCRLENVKGMPKDWMAP